MTPIQSGRDITSGPTITSDCSLSKRKGESMWSCGEKEKRKRRKEKGGKRESDKIKPGFQRRREEGTQGQS